METTPRSETDRAALRALAEKATPGPWEVDRNTFTVWGILNPDPDSAANVVYPEDEGRGLEMSVSDAEYIAAASPDTVLALLDALDATERPASPSDDEREALPRAGESLAWHARCPRANGRVIADGEGGWKCDRCGHVEPPASPSDAGRATLADQLEDIVRSLNGPIGEDVNETLLAAASALRSRSASHPRTEAEWEYGVVAEAFGGEPALHNTLESAEHVRGHSTTFYKKWTHGSKVTIFRRTKSGPWEPLAAADAVHQTGSE